MMGGTTSSYSTMAAVSTLMQVGLCPFRILYNRRTMPALVSLRKLFCCFVVISLLFVIQQQVTAAPLPHLDTPLSPDVTSFGISPDGRYLVFVQRFPPPAGRDNNIHHLRLFDLHTLSLRTLATNAAGFNRIAFESGDRFAYLSGWEGVILMDVSGKELRRFPSGGYHAFCNNTRFLGTVAGVELLSADHRQIKAFSGKGEFTHAVCSPERLLLIFKQQASLLDAKSLEPVCTFVAKDGSLTNYQQGALLGNNRFALLGHWAGVALFDACKQTRKLIPDTMAMAHTDQLLLGHAGVVKAGRNQGAFSSNVGLLHYTTNGSYLQTTQLPEVVRQMAPMPGRPELLMVLAQNGPFRLLNLKTGRQLTLTLQHNSPHWLLADDSGAYRASPGTERQLYFTDGNRLLPAGPLPADSNLYLRFIGATP